MKTIGRVDYEKVELIPNRDNENIMIVSYGGESLFMINRGDNLKTAIYYYNQGLNRGFQEGKYSVQNELRNLLDIPPRKHGHSDLASIRDEDYRGR